MIDYCYPWHRDIDKERHKIECNYVVQSANNVEAMKTAMEINFAAGRVLPDVPYLGSYLGPDLSDTIKEECRANPNMTPFDSTQRLGLDRFMNGGASYLEAEMRLVRAHLAIDSYAAVKEAHEICDMIMMISNCDI